MRIRKRTIMLIIVGLVVISAQPGYASSPDSVLLVQQTPVNGGTVTPDLGAHNLNTGKMVTLNATPKPGYQFLYWLGDVADPTANRTTLFLEGPKIVIAVFERNKHEFLAQSDISISQGPEIVTPRRINIPRGLPSSAPGGRDDDRPDYNEPIPEPATAILLMLGSGMLFFSNNKRRKTT